MRLVAAAKAVQDILETNKDTLELGAVYYGDQRRIAQRFTACVEPGEDQAALQGAFRRVTRVVVVYVLLYGVAISAEDSSREATDVKAEAIEALLNQDPSMGGDFTHSYVKSLESGYTPKDGSLIASCRLTVECTRNSDML